MLTQESAHG